MPHTSSAKKHIRQSEKRRQRNRADKKTIKLQLRKVLAASKTGSADDLRKEVSLATKKLDQAAAKRVMHPNTVARRKSQLGKLLHKKQTGGPAPAPAKA